MTFESMIGNCKRSIPPVGSVICCNEDGKVFISFVVRIPGFGRFQHPAAGAMDKQILIRFLKL